jgi:Family of unknown function (DUF6384)
MPEEQSEPRAVPDQADQDKSPRVAVDTRADAEMVGHSGPVAQPDLSLQDMTRIMEVASTLRKERDSAQQQLNLDDTKALLRERLLETTKVTGELLSPAEVERAVEQYYDNLHTFVDPPWSFSVMLAQLYVRRALLLKWLLAVAAIVALIAI